MTLRVRAAERDERQVERQVLRVELRAGRDARGHHERQAATRDHLDDVRVRDERADAEHTTEVDAGAVLTRERVERAEAEDEHVEAERATVGDAHVNERAGAPVANRVVHRLGTVGLQLLDAVDGLVGAGRRRQAVLRSGRPADQPVVALTEGAVDLRLLEEVAAVRDERRGGEGLTGRRRVQEGDRTVVLRADRLDRTTRDRRDELRGSRRVVRVVRAEAGVAEDVDGARVVGERDVVVVEELVVPELEQVARGVLGAVGVSGADLRRGERVARRGRRGRRRGQAQRQVVAEGAAARLVAGLAVRRVLEELLAAIHEDAVVELHADVVAELDQAVRRVVVQRVAGAGALIDRRAADDREVGEAGRGDRLPGALLGAVHLDGVVAHARALAVDAAAALDDQAELRLAAPALVDVEAVVTAEPDADVLQVDGAAPDLDAVIDVREDVDVVDVRGAADGAERQAVELVAVGDVAAAVAERAVREDAAVVVVVVAAVVVVGRVRRADALHVAVVVGVRRRDVGADAAGVDVGLTHDGEVAPLLAGVRAVGAGLRGGRPGDRGVLGAFGEDLAARRDDERAVVRGHRRARADGQAGAAGDVAVADDLEGARADVRARGDGGSGDEGGALVDAILSRHGSRQRKDDQTEVETVHSCDWGFLRWRIRSTHPGWAAPQTRRRLGRIVRTP